MSDVNPALRPLGTGDACYHRYRSDLLAALASERQLSRLRSGGRTDWVIALLESWATVADIISFYAERILNDAFLATVEQPDARSRLYRSLGHSFDANTAATTVLSYQVSDRAAGVEAVRRARRDGAGGAVAPTQASPALPPPPPPPSPSQIAVASPASAFGVPRRELAAGTGVAPPTASAATPGTKTLVTAGSQVRAVPDPGALPPVFVTLGALDARPGLSGLRPAVPPAPGPAPLTLGMTQLELAGTATGLRAGDPVLITADADDGGAGHAQPWLRTLTAVIRDPQRKSTRIGWSEPLSTTGEPAATVTTEPTEPTEAPEPADVLGPGTVHAFAVSAQLVGSDAQLWEHASPATRAAAFAVSPPTLGGVLRSTDGGTSWTAVAALPPTVTELTAVAAFGDLMLAGAGRAGAAVSVAGSPFAAARLPVGRPAVSCVGGSRSRLVLGTSDGHVLQSGDDGRSWTRVDGGPPTKVHLRLVRHQLPGAPVHAIVASALGAGLLAGTGSGLYLGGETGWDPVPQVTEEIFALLRLGPELAVAGGVSGVKVLTGRAASLKVTAGLAGSRVFALASIAGAGGPVLYAGTDSGVQRAADAGFAHWQPVNGEGRRALPPGSSVIGLAAQSGTLLAATSAGLYRSADDGQGWDRCTTVELWRVVVPTGSVAAGVPPPTALLAEFSARGIAFPASARVTGSVAGLTLTDQSAVTYRLTVSGGKTSADPESCSVALADGLPGVTSVAAGADGTLIACVSPVSPLANEWPGFLVAGDQLEISSPRRSVSGGRGAIVQQTDHPRSRVLDIARVEHDAGLRFGRAATLARLILAGDAIPACQFPRRTSTVWLGAAPLESYVPTACAVQAVSGASIHLSAPLAVAPPAGRLATITGMPLQVTVAPLGGALRIASSSVTALGPAQADALSLCMTATGDTVLGTTEGVFIFPAHGTGPIAVGEGWRGDPATSVVSPDHRTVLAATPAGLLRLSKAPGGWAASRWVEGGLGPLRITALTGSGGRAVAAVAGGGAFELRPAASRPAGQPPAGQPPAGQPPAGQPSLGQPVWSPLTPLPDTATALLVSGDQVYAATGTDVLTLEAGAWRSAGLAAPARVTGLAVDTAGALWAGSPHGVASLRPGNREWRHDPSAGDGTGVTALASGPDGGLTAAMATGIWSRPPKGGWALVACPGASLNALAYAADRSLWAAASSAIVITPQTGAVAVTVRSAVVFTDVPITPEDVATLDQGGLPAIMAEAFDEGGCTLNRALLTVAAASGGWRLTAGADVYLVARRETRHGPRVNGYACPPAATIAGQPILRSGLETLPVSYSGGQGTIRARPETVIVLRAAPDSAALAETVRLGPPDQEDPTGVLQLMTPLANVYDAATVQVNLNVVAAAHGTPVTVVLGTGDPALASQRFRLTQPVALVANRAATGGEPGAEPESSLSISVDGVPWTRTEALLTAAPDARVYTFHADQDGSGIVSFGDGAHGSRLPAGPVVASYLQGGGTAGLVAEGTLIQPLDRPQLVQSVHNPQPARRPLPAPPSAPLARARVLDRIVTLRDVRDAAEACPGVASARVQLIGGVAREIVVTLAAEPGAELDAVVSRVTRALRERTAPDVPLSVLAAARVPVLLNLRVLDASGVPLDGTGWPAAERALRGRLAGLSARRPGDPLLASQILAATNAADGEVPGGVAAAITGWGRVGAVPVRRPALTAQPARRLSGSRALCAAELLYVDADGDHLTITAAED